MKENKYTLKETFAALDALQESVEEDYYLRAYITNLGKYNEGDLVGQWVDFPIDEDDFKEVLKSIGVSDEPNEDGEYYEEWFVTDYDCNIPGFDWQDLGEYPSYDTLNDFAEKFADSDIDRVALANAFEVVGDLDEAVEGLENGTIIFYPDIDSAADLGQYVVENFYGDSLPEELIERYFDYEALGRDLGFDSYENDDYDPEDPDSEEYISAGEYWCGDEDADDYDIGQAFVDAVGIDGVSHKDYYFDYDAFGNDLLMENFTLTTDGAIEQY